MDLNQVHILGTDELLGNIKEAGYQEIANILKDKNIDGAKLLELSELQTISWKLPLSQKRSLFHFIDLLKANPGIILKSPKRLSEQPRHIQRPKQVNPFKLQLESLLGNNEESSPTSDDNIPILKSKKPLPTPTEFNSKTTVKKKQQLPTPTEHDTKYNLSNVHETNLDPQCMRKPGSGRKISNDSINVPQLPPKCTKKMPPPLPNSDKEIDNTNTARDDLEDYMDMDSKVGEIPDDYLTPNDLKQISDRGKLGVTDTSKASPPAPPPPPLPKNLQNVEEQSDYEPAPKIIGAHSAISNNKFSVPPHIANRARQPLPIQKIDSTEDLLYEEPPKDSVSKSINRKKYFDNSPQTTNPQILTLPSQNMGFKTKSAENLTGTGIGSEGRNLDTANPISSTMSRDHSKTRRSSSDRKTPPINTGFFKDFGNVCVVGSTETKGTGGSKFLKNFISKNIYENQHLTSDFPKEFEAKKHGFINRPLPPIPSFQKREEPTPVLTASVAPARMRRLSTSKKKSESRTPVRATETILKQPPSDPSTYVELTLNPELETADDTQFYGNIPSYKLANRPENANIPVKNFRQTKSHEELSLPDQLAFKLSQELRLINDGDSEPEYDNLPSSKRSYLVNSEETHSGDHKNPPNRVNQTRHLRTPSSTDDENFDQTEDNSHSIYGNVENLNPKQSAQKVTKYDKEHIDNTANCSYYGNTSSQNFPTGRSNVRSDLRTGNNKRLDMHLREELSLVLTKKPFQRHTNGTEEPEELEYGNLPHNNRSLVTPALNIPSHHSGSLGRVKNESMNSSPSHTDEKSRTKTNDKSTRVYHNLPKPPPFKPENIDQNLLETNEDCLFNINNEPFYRNTDRTGAKQLLRNLADGAFLFRPSTSFFLVLTVKYNKKFYNLGVHRKNNKLYLNSDKDSDTPGFPTIRTFVDYFTKEAVSFEDNGQLIEVFLNPILPSNVF